MPIQTNLIFVLAILLGACGGSGSGAKEEKDVSSRAANLDSSAQSAKKNILRITDLETEIQLPDGADKLSRYDRYYLVSGDEFNAIYIRNLDGDGSVFVVSSRQEMPQLMDGGCQVINVTGNFSAPVNATVFCNGVA